SHVKGGIQVEKPNRHGFSLHMGKQRPRKIVVDPDAVVEGALVFEREVTLYVHDSARIGTVTGATVVRFSTPTPPQRSPATPTPPAGGVGGLPGPPRANGGC